MWEVWCSGGRVGAGASGALQLRVWLASRRIERRILRLDPFGPAARRACPSLRGACDTGADPRAANTASLPFVCRSVSRLRGGGL